MSPVDPVVTAHGKHHISLDNCVMGILHLRTCRSLENTKTEPSVGDGHLAGLCAHPLASYMHSSRLSASENAIGSMGMSAEQMHGPMAQYYNPL